MLFELFLIVVLGVLCYLHSLRRPHNYPPGPRWLPVVGNLPLLKKLSRAYGGQHVAFWELSKQIGTRILGLKLGRDLVVVVISHDLVKTVLTSEEFEGRPNNFFIKLRSLGTNKGITFTDGEFWMIQRTFVVRHLRSLGFGKRIMEQRVNDELHEILRLMRQNGRELQIGRLIAPAVLNVLWSLTAGARIPRDDPRLTKLLDLFNLRSKAFDMSGGILNQYPWLRHIAPEYSGYNLITKLNSELKDFFMEAIEGHHETWSEDRNDDLIYSYITEMKRTNGHPTTFTNDQLLMICMDLFIAGSLTTSNTLDFAFLSMLLHPQVQRKAQKILDETFDENQPVEYADRHKVPYIEAVLLEVQRLYHVTPVIGPRRVLKDTTLEGYNIPKNTTVLINLYSIHMDPERWGDPEIFRPERFIDSSGQLIPQNDVIQFGLGRRRCLGELLVRSFLFVFFAEILRRYTILPVSSQKHPTGIPLPGILLSPEKYSARFIPRYKTTFT